MKEISDSQPIFFYHLCSEVMAKRKGLDYNREEEPESEESSSEESSSDDVRTKSLNPTNVFGLNSAQDTNMLDVEFEWFDPQPEHDFHGLKTLLRQLFDVDAQSFDLSALTNLILAQPLLGSTVKVDGNETDPYAFLTVLNLHEHKVLQKCDCERVFFDEAIAQTSHRENDHLHQGTSQAQYSSFKDR